MDNENPITDEIDETEVQDGGEAGEAVPLLAPPTQQYSTEEQTDRSLRLQTLFGLEVLVPPAAQRQRIHSIIYDELCLGEIRASSRAEYLAIIAGLAEAGAQAVIQSDSSRPASTPPRAGSMAPPKHS